VSLVRADLLRPTAGFAAHDLRADWGELTPRLALNWTPARAVLLYASATRGFTAGGFNTDATSLAALVQPFDPETVLNHELGLKSQWLDNRLRVNLSVFDMRYRDKQEFVNNSLTGILSITNASRATVRGAELELAWKPAPWLGLSANYGHLDTRYDRFEIGNIHYTGNPLASSPRGKASLAADWRVPVPLGQVFGAISCGWQSDYNTGAANDPNLRIAGYALLNMNLGLESADRRWRVQAWVKNATDRDYILTRSTQVVRAEYLGEPRTFGVTAGVRF
jgi:iron complex outermembrane receptor protein